MERHACSGMVARWVVVGALGTLVAAGAVAGEPSAPAELTAESAAPAGQEGMRVYRDPVTGEFGVPPPGATVEPPAEAIRAPARPVPFQGTSPAGGQGMDVRGLPQPTMKATVTPDGKVRAECVHGSTVGKQ